MEDTLERQIKDLLKRFASESYSSSRVEEVALAKDEEVLDICIQMWKLDYKCDIIDNKNGNLCGTYPSRIVVPLYELGASGEMLYKCPLSESVIQSKEPILRDSSEEGATALFSSVVAGSSPSSSIANTEVTQGSDTQENYETLESAKSTLREYMMAAKEARCRYRFPVPVVLCKGKYISRSATISCSLDVWAKYLIYPYNDDHELLDLQTWYSKLQTLDVETARLSDIELLKAIGTSSIIDLMVENKKIKFFFTITSSEKADSENRYSDFRITSLPYPGCEFFKEFTNKNLSSRDLCYNWEAPVNDAPLLLPNEGATNKVSKDWSEFKTWNLRTLTGNYLKLIMNYISDKDSIETGILVHCISGWDRTPLFISILRLTFWADGHAHSSLNATQILFFTLAYDWYLFGHQLPDRMKYFENILYFCFEFLDVIGKQEEPSEDSNRERHPSTESANFDIIDGASEVDAASSFGSATSSIASSSSSNPHIPPSLGPNPTIKVSPLKQIPVEGEWPYNKENKSFTFDGISENESSGGLKVSDKSENLDGNLGYSGGLASRSPLKERNKATPVRKSRKLSGDETTSNLASSSANVTSDSRSPLKASSVGGRKSNSHGFIRDFPGRRSRKNFSTESPAIVTTAASPATVTTPESPSKLTTDKSPTELTTSARESHPPDITGSDAEIVSGPATNPLANRQASNPIPVPGGRSRHSSSSSSISNSWQIISTSEPFKESVGPFGDGHRSSKTSLTAEMVDSANTITEEATPSSSLESKESYVVFRRQRRLREVSLAFFKFYGEVPEIQIKPSTGVTAIIMQKYGQLKNMVS